MTPLIAQACDTSEVQAYFASLAALPGLRSPRRNSSPRGPRTDLSSGRTRWG